MTKHTPGPWVADDLDCVWQDEVGHVLIANCRNSKQAHLTDLPTADERAANARLVAGAIDLLARLEASQRLLVSYANQERDRDNHTQADAIMRHVGLNQDAIRQAKGAA